MTRRIPEQEQRIWREQTLKVLLKKSDYEKSLAYARSERPDEACGLIAGKDLDDGITREVRKVYMLTNIDHTNEHFSMDPKEQLAAVKDMRANGFMPLGNWHSHPETPARPSEEDIRLSFDSRASYLILSLRVDERPEINSYHVVHCRDVAKEQLVLVD